MGKKDGVVYTPVDVVDKMLDMVGYFPDKKPGFLETDFLDNSCGNGNILVVALERAAGEIGVVGGIADALGQVDETLLTCQDVVVRERAFHDECPVLLLVSTGIECY